MVQHGLSLLLCFMLAFDSLAQTNSYPDIGSVGIGTMSPAGNLQVVGSTGWDSSTKFYLTNGASDYGRTNFILTGRLQAGNDSWAFGTTARSSIVFSSNSSSSVGLIGSEQFSIQHQQAINSLGFMSQMKGTSPILVMTQSGNVGIGPSSPDSKLHVTGGAIVASDPNFNNINVRLDGTSVPTIRFTRYTGTPSHYHNAFIGQFFNAYYSSYSLGIGIGSSATADANASENIITIPLNGNVGIGTTTPDKKLTVKGVIHTNEVLVDLNHPIEAPDYVFERGYKLLPLDKLSEYITVNKHLPEVPSADEMVEKGLNLKEMNLLLLKKVEELTLHLISQNEDIKSLNEEIRILKMKLE